MRTCRHLTSQVTIGAMVTTAPYRLIADGLRDQILDGRLAAGAKLPSEHELAARHQVARATVQSALRRLQHDGLITSRKGAGHFVAGAAVAGPGRCPARLELDPSQLAWLDRRPWPGHEPATAVRCELEHTHAGAHAALGRRTVATGWWIRWTLRASEINGYPSCPHERACRLYEGHPGRHALGVRYA
ncbi:winged helix-turn-helix domain-containing protein [Actinoplanes sp. CA-030573]|uniref:winged helix-turn-helix domain-containing protein n=1 Tax=Actinoplanes sp. CA-030573 TaxID=3239898 RepID=UPI003D94433A